MKYAMWGLILLVSGGAVSYLLGWLILRHQGYRWRGIPPVYDSKEPYEQWAAKMEHARRLQAKEEA